MPGPSIPDNLKIKRIRKTGKQMEKLKIILRTLATGEPLDAIHRNHKLISNGKGRRECHIEADWLLIYKREEKRIIFERTGTHSDLFRS